MSRATEPPDRRRGQRLLVTEKVPGEASYSLRIGAEHVDVAGFQQSIRAGQAALRPDMFSQAAGHLRGALALWRGRPLADVAHLELQHQVLNRTLPRRGLLAA